MMKNPGSYPNMVLPVFVEEINNINDMTRSQTSCRRSELKGRWRDV